jgi:hypothetical protein
VHRVERAHLEQAAADARLVAGHHHAVAGLVQRAMASRLPGSASIRRAS